MEGIVKVLDTRPDTKPDIVWKERTVPWKRKYWQIDVQKSLGKKTSWIVDTAHGIDQASLIPDLTAGLSLWIYSLIGGRTSLKRLHIPSGLGMDHWAFDAETAGRNSMFVRIISSSEIYTAQEIQSWIPKCKLSHFGARYIPSYDSEWDIDLIPEMASVHTWPVHPWPVFGLYYSASFE